MRNARIEQYLHLTDTQGKEILEALPECLKDGYRTIFMLERRKDGGHNKEEKRVFNFAVTTKPEELEQKLKEFLWMKHYYDKDLRIYLSVNRRNPIRAVRNILERIIESYHVDDVNRDLIVKKITKGSRAYIMAPNARDSRMFLLDVDDMEGRDMMGEALQEMARLDVEEIYRIRTKNGWHVVTKPFNFGLWQVKDVEVKKDGLLLLDY